MHKGNQTPFNIKTKGNQFTHQLKRVYLSFNKSLTMKEVDKTIGVIRENICWYCKKLRIAL